MGPTKQANAKTRSSAERQKEYRERLKNNPGRYEQHKKKERERYYKNKPQKDQLTERDVRYQRKLWRKRSRDYRKRQREQEKADERMRETTPPPTPEANHARAQSVQKIQKMRGQRLVRRDRSKLYRRVKALEQQLQSAQRLTEKHKKRYQRLKYTTLSTPEKEAKKLMKGMKKNEEIRRSLVFGKTISLALREKYKDSKSAKLKQTIAKIIACRIKRSKIATTKKELEIEQRVLRSGDITRDNRKTYNSIGRRLAECVKTFLCRDDNSRLTTSKHDTVSVHGKKLQRRLLTESLGRLHKKFCSEDSNNKMSYSLFCKLKPKDTVAPTTKDRETCLCELHEIDRRKQLKVLAETITYVHACVEAAVCSNPTQLCYERKCEHCNNLPKLTDIPDHTNEDSITWKQWMLIKEDRVIKGKNVVVQRSVKKTIIGTLEELKQQFNAILPKLCWHLMVIQHQFKKYHELKEENNSIIIVVDFSENYTIENRENRAVQSAHFGASNQQLTLHTGVAYIGENTISFCSVSDCTRHDPSAIWAHIEPILNLVRRQFPDVDFMHFWSDGPTSQYRNKQNFLLLSRIIDMGIKGCTWNFFESGHGKSAADAIGGVVKRTADQAVNMGTSIHNAESFRNIVSERTKVKIILVTELEIKKNDDLLNKITGLKATPGTMKLHQLVTLEKHCLRVRNFSCFCTFPIPCLCYAAHDINFPSQQEPVENVINEKNRSQIMNDEYTAQKQVPEHSNTSEQPNDQVIRIMVSKSQLETNQANNVTTNMGTLKEVKNDVSNDNHDNTPNHKQKWNAGEFVLVELYSGQAKKKYVAQIADNESSNDEVNLRYMVEKRGLYYWPAVDDESCENVNVIVKCISKPITNKAKSTTRRLLYNVNL